MKYYHLSKEFGPVEKSSEYNYLYTGLHGDYKSKVVKQGLHVRNRESGSYKGVGIKGFKKLVKTGKFLPFTSYLRFDHSGYHPPCSYFGVNYTTSRSYRFESNPSHNVEGVTTTADQVDQVIGELSAGVNLQALKQEALADIAPDLDILTSGAELPKTVLMVLNLRRKLTQLVNKALWIDSKRNGSIEAAEVIAALWTEWRYGWRILGFEADAIVKYLHEPIQRTTVSGKGTEVINDTVVCSTTDSNYYCTYDRESTVDRELKIQAFYSGRYQEPSSVVKARSNALVALPVTLYELIPYSFMADFVFSAGDAIKAAYVSSQLVDLAGCVRYSYTEVGSMKCTNVRDGTGVNAQPGSGSMAGSATTVTTLKMRIPCGAPSFSPVYRNDLSASKIADVVAILGVPILSKLKTKKKFEGIIRKQSAYVDKQLRKLDPGKFTF